MELLLSYFIWSRNDMMPLLALLRMLTVCPIDSNELFVNRLPCRKFKVVLDVQRFHGTSVVLFLLYNSQIIVTLLKVLKVDNHRLMQTAWNYMNDSLRSDVFVRYHPESIACACIYLGARILQIALPNKPAWYLIFDVTEEDIHIICRIILSLYCNKKPEPERLEKTVEEVKKVHLEAKLKAKGIASANAMLANHSSFSPTSTPSSPKNGKSPIADIKKEKEDSKANNGVTKESNHRKRSASPMDEDDSPRHRKKHKTSSSGSQSSRTPSPRHKHGKTPPRGYKESRKSRSRSRSRTRDNKKAKHRSSHKSRKRSPSASTSPVAVRKHASKKTYKTKTSKGRHVSKSPPRVYEHNHYHHHTNSHEKSHKSTRKDKTVHQSKEKSRR